MTNAVRRVCLSCVLLAVPGCFAQAFEAPERAEGRTQSLQVRTDLALEVPDVVAALRFSHREIAEDSCEIYEGCALGAGRRSVIELEVVVRNAGRDPLELGAPWDSPYFSPSLCQQTNTMYGFLAAELRDANGQLVAAGSLSSNCLADRTGGYTCMAQGLGAGSAVAQPQSQCDYLDVTDLPAGDYRLTVTVNPGGAIPETNRDNNTVELAFYYPACPRELCGGTCCPEGSTCRDGACLLPDLRINEESASQSLWITEETFGENSCELEEQCVSGSGRRRLLRFESRIENLGPGDLSPGPEAGNPLFEFSACHEHYHFRDFTNYQLLDADGNVVAQGHKQAFCLLDMEPIDDAAAPSPPGTRPRPEPMGEVFPGGPVFQEGCNYLSAGWADIYSIDTDCQWVDITDVAAGDYVLSLSVNPLGRVAETTTDNNSVRIPVSVPADVPCEPQAEVCGDAVDQDCDGQPDVWDEDCSTGGCEPWDPFCETPTAVTGNDTCQTAYELTEAGTFQGTLPAASSTSLPVCGGSGASAYFRFELSEEQAVYLGAIGSSVDTVVALYAGGCDAEPLRCGDDDCGTTSGHFVAILPPGSSLAAVGGKRPDAAGSYRFEFERAAPGGAQIIARPGVYAGNTASSGDDIQACAALGTATGRGPDDLYVLATCNSPVTVSTCGTTTFYSVLEARTASDFELSTQCSTSGESDCRSDPMGSTLTAYNTSAGMMFIAVDGERAEDSGDYQLSISY